jgi:hypothetical protein
LICDIFDLVVDEVECTSEESIGFYLDFEYQNAENDFYELFANDLLIGYYPLDELPMWIEDFPIQEGENILSVCINDTENCCEEYVFEEIDCSDFECMIDELNYEVEFISQDSFIVILDFEYNSDDLDQFSIHGNGIYYGEFMYGETPVVLGPYSCRDELALEYIVRDLSDPDCRQVLEVGIIDCPMSAHQQTFSELMVYENERVLYIDDPSAELLDKNKVKVYTVVGQLQLSEVIQNPGSLNSIPLNGIIPGIYYVEIENKENRSVFRIAIN